MPIKLRQNAYRGVNAHLNSALQTRGDDSWQGFHQNYLVDLARAINQTLPAGYIVNVERSLQIREYEAQTGELLRVRRPRPDLTVYTSKSGAANSLTADAPAITLPLAETVLLADDIYYGAVVIYETLDDVQFGRPLVRIELLSPSNKVGAGALQYLDKRAAALESGLRLIEIDLLHETRPLLWGLPVYSLREAQAQPYYIAIDDPTPTLREGAAIIYPFGVDEPPPPIPVPLVGTDTVVIDFDAAYQTTFHGLDAYAFQVDYAQPPERFDSYSETDQARILAVMARAQALAGQPS